jgi:Holliday junction resolvase RusA-like endonuclease
MRESDVARCDKCHGSGWLSPPLMRFTLTEPITPYVHRTAKGKHSARAQRYHASQNAIGLQLRNQMQLNGWRFIPRGIPLALYLRVTRPTIHNLDATNLQKAIEDACNGRVFGDDCWVDDIHTVVTKGTEHQAVLEVRKLQP